MTRNKSPIKRNPEDVKNIIKTAQTAETLEKDIRKKVEETPEFKARVAEEKERLWAERAERRQREAQELAKLSAEEQAEKAKVGANQQKVAEAAWAKWRDKIGMFNEETLQGYEQPETVVMKMLVLGKHLGDALREEFQPLSALINGVTGLGSGAINLIKNTLGPKLEDLLYPPEVTKSYRNPIDNAKFVQKLYDGIEVSGDGSFKISEDLLPKGTDGVSQKLYEKQYEYFETCIALKLLEAGYHRDKTNPKQWKDADDKAINGDDLRAALENQGGLNARKIHELATVGVVDAPEPGPSAEIERPSPSPTSPK